MSDVIPSVVEESRDNNEISPQGRDDTFRLPYGAVIMFDGPDWIGKTTQVKLAAEALRQAGYEVWTTRVNGGTPIGEALRTAMFGDYDRPVMTDLHIHMAQQYALEPEIINKRHAGMVILVDRSPVSIIAYQVYGEGLDEATGYAAADEAMGIYRPELVIAYTAAAELLQGRRAEGNHLQDYFEKQPDDYFDRVTQGYTAGAQHYHAQVIDASGDIGVVHAETMRQITTVLHDLSGRAAGASAAS